MTLLRHDMTSTPTADGTPTRTSLKWPVASRYPVAADCMPVCTAMERLQASGSPSSRLGTRYPANTDSIWSRMTGKKAREPDLRISSAVPATGAAQRRAVASTLTSGVACRSHRVNAGAKLLRAMPALVGNTITLKRERVMPKPSSRTARTLRGAKARKRSGVMRHEAAVDASVTAIDVARSPPAMNDTALAAWAAGQQERRMRPVA
mmetsp:Transcript_23468/g.49100  ORF Transcript_23468/g.49100 Transcript_23468/m.49100 type:complete len:207 (+) Transcript_23468:63-683(+)